MDLSKIEKGVELILKGLGVDLKDRNFIETPERVARFYEEMFGEKKGGWATFEEEYTDFILLKGYRMYSLCPHHLLPVEFHVSLAYIPNGKVLGLSKLARVLDECNDGPLLQERFTVAALQKIQEITDMQLTGCAILIDGQHGCTKIRGVKSDAHFLTYRLEGVFKNNIEMEKRFFQLARRQA